MFERVRSSQSGTKHVVAWKTGTFNTLSLCGRWFYPHAPTKKDKPCQGCARVLGSLVNEFGVWEENDD
jgi:hypothetical protein